jgi:glycosyltransferase involved in cell wall biosynthesis
MSLADVHSVNPNFLYRLVGEGDDRLRLVDLATDLGIRGNVVADHALDDGGLADALSTCDVFILPSAGEGFGLADVEAMCAGKPVIVASAGSSPEVVDQESGLLVRYGDTDGLTEAILQLMNDATLCNRLGVNGRARFREHFTEAAFQSRLKYLVERL